MEIRNYQPEYEELKKVSEEDAGVLEQVMEIRREGRRLQEEEKYDEGVRKAVEALRKLRDTADYSHVEVRAAVMILLFDLAEAHYALADYKQSKKELELIFKVLEPLLKEDGKRFGRYHVLAMELSTRILRSRKKMLDLLAKQQIHTGMLYEKVNAGVSSAIDKLVESLRRGAEMLASTGDYNGAIKFYMEAIKLSKKRSGRVARRDVAMTIDLAKLMMKSKRQSERAHRLLNAVLPHAVSLEIIEFEQEILQLLKQIDENVAYEPKWRTFLEKISLKKFNREGRSEKMEGAVEEDADDKQVKDNDKEEKGDEHNS